MSAYSASTGSPLYPQVPDPGIQPITDWKYLWGESSLKFQKAVFEFVRYASSCLYGIYIVFTAIYLAFTLY